MIPSSKIESKCEYIFAYSFLFIYFHDWNAYHISKKALAMHRTFFCNMGNNPEGAFYISRAEYSNPKSYIPSHFCQRKKRENLVDTSALQCHKIMRGGDCMPDLLRGRNSAELCRRSRKPLPSRIAEGFQKWRRHVRRTHICSFALRAFLSIQCYRLGQQHRLLKKSVLSAIGKLRLEYWIVPRHLLIFSGSCSDASPISWAPRL